MFVTQSEIEARLASDANLLNLLVEDSLTRLPSGQDHQKEKVELPEDIDSESFNEFDETTSANISLAINRSEIRQASRDAANVDNDVKLARILEDCKQEHATRPERNGSGRPAGSIDRSTEQRADIALMGQVLGIGSASSVLGVSTASPSLHSRGVVNHGDEIDIDLTKAVKRKLNKIRDKSASAIIHILDMADDAQMYEQIKTAKEAVFVASQLANVVNKVQPKEEDIKPTAQFIIIQPTVKNIEQYEVINV